eukprot:10188876-Alexandrium_andersonii.AAC.1
MPSTARAHTSCRHNKSAHKERAQPRMRHHVSICLTPVRKHKGAQGMHGLAYARMRAQEAHAGM